MAHKIDTATAVATMPVAAAAGTPGWFTDANPLNPTHLDADWCNMVQGELTNIVTAFGGTLTKGVVNQIATALTEYVLTNGRFSNSLYAIADAGFVDGYGFRVYGIVLPGSVSPQVRASGLRGSTLYMGADSSEVKTIDTNRDAWLRNVEASGDITASGSLKAGTKTSISASTGTINVNSKAAIDGATGDISTAGKAEITGKVTASGGVKTVTPTNVTATWDTDHWVATINQVGGRINIDFSAHPLGAGGSVLLQITCDKMDASSRVHYTMESQANIAGGADGLPVACPQGPSIPGGVVIYNIKGTLDTAETLAFDVVNPV